MPPALDHQLADWRDHIMKMESEKIIVSHPDLTPMLDSK